MSVTSTVRLKAIADNIPKGSEQVVEQAVEAGVKLLDEEMPVDTGYMVGAKYGRVINQYAAEIVSPASYTIYQEEGFFNTWAQRWLPGKWFMQHAEDEMAKVATEGLEKMVESL